MTEKTLHIYARTLAGLLYRPVILVPIVLALIVADYVGYSGIGSGFIRPKGFPRRSIDAIMNDVRERIHQLVPALDIDLALLMADVENTAGIRYYSIAYSG